MSRPSLDESYDIVRLVERGAHLLGLAGVKQALPATVLYHRSCRWRRSLLGLAGVRQGTGVSATPRFTMRHCKICRSRRMLPRAGWTKTLRWVCEHEGRPGGNLHERIHVTLFVDRCVENSL